MSGSIWAVSCLFNPQGSERRVLNYRRFRQSLSIPLVAVELSFDGRFELEAEDADILVRVTEGDLMWQKERLINLGVRALPSDCRTVAVLDSDILFARDDWPEASVQALETARAVQPFSRAFYLSRDATPSPGGVEAEGDQASVANLVDQGYPARDCLGTTYRDGRGPVAAPGLAWVYRRDLLQRHGLFEASILGGGDTAVAAASWGVFDAINERHVLNERQNLYYRMWAEPWFRDVDAHVAGLEGDLFHLWHGDIANRKAGMRSRHPELASAGFDPFQDLLDVPGSAWRFARDRPALRSLISNFFIQRRDDG